MHLVLGGTCNTIRSLAREFKTRYEPCEGRILCDGGEILKEVYILPRNALARVRENRVIFLTIRQYNYIKKLIVQLFITLIILNKIWRILSFFSS